MVYVFLADGFEELEALTPVDYLKRAGIEVTTVGIGTDMPTGSHGIAVKADISQEDFRLTEDTEALFLPGGMPGTLNLGASAVVTEAILAAYESKRNIVLAAICAAPTVYKEQGLLEERKATCFPGFAEKLGDSFRDKDVVWDKPVLTGRGAGVAQQFTFKLIELLRDKKTAEEIAERVCFRGEMNV